MGMNGFLRGYQIGSAIGKDFKEALKAKALAEAASVAPESFTHQRPAGETTSGTEGMNYDSDTGQYLPKFMDSNGQPTEQAQAQLNATPEAPAAMPEGKLPTFDTEISTKYRLGDQEQDAPFSSDQVGMHRLSRMSDIALRSGNPVEAAQFDALAAKRREAADQTAIRDALTVPRGMAKVPTGVSSGMGGNGTASNEHQPAGAAVPGQGMRRQGGYLETVTPRVTEAYLRQGKVNEAKAWRDFAESEQGHQYAENFTNAQRRVTAGDYEGAIPFIQQLHGQFPDGKRAQTEHVGNGQYRVTMIDEATGKPTGQRVMAAADLSRMAINALSPTKMVETMIASQAKRDTEAASLSKSIELERLRQQGQDVRDDRRDERLNRQLGAMDVRLSKQLEARERGGGLTLSQQRQNEEIEAAREAVAGLSPEEIRIRTTPALASGRDNPNYDPRLSTAAKAANRRKLGEDPYFDQRQGRQPGTESFAGKPLAEMTEQQLHQFGRAAGAEGKAKIGAELARRTFAGDQALKGHQLGDMVPGKGYKVLDPQGRHVGYWGQR